jgi:Fe-S-cluster-containing hydrogenase component 2
MMASMEDFQMGTPAYCKGAFFQAREYVTENHHRIGHINKDTIATAPRPNKRCDAACAKTTSTEALKPDSQ